MSRPSPYLELSISRQPLSFSLAVSLIQFEISDKKEV